MRLRCGDQGGAGDPGRWAGTTHPGPVLPVCVGRVQDEEEQTDDELSQVYLAHIRDPFNCKTCKHKQCWYSLSEDSDNAGTIFLRNNNNVGTSFLKD